MIHLPQVTLILLSGIGYRTEKNINALEYSQRGIEFGAVKYIQLGEITDIDAWSRASIYELPKYVHTEFCLLIHENGFVVNPESWKDEWLEYDYVGSPWPMPTDDVAYRDKDGKVRRVGNSVSLRSKKLLDLANEIKLPWKKFNGFYNEDGFICVNNTHIYEENGCKFAPIEVAKHFGREIDIPEVADVDKPFIFHYNKTLAGRNKEFEPLFL